MYHIFQVHLTRENKRNVETVHWTFCTEETKGWHALKEDSHEEDPVSLESQVKVALKVPWRNKSCGVDGHW